MFSPWFSVKPILTQVSASPQLSPATSPTEKNVSGGGLWMSSTIVLFVILAAVVAYGQFQLNKTAKAVKFEEFKNKDLQKKLKLALVTIKKMETNPDLVYSRAFNLDYLRMRMDEEVFHYIIVNQIKIKVTQLIGEVLRPSTSKNAVGIVGSGRKIEETFDVIYEVEAQEGKWNKGVLFRIFIKLTKLPTQSTSTTISQIIDCIETFLAPISEQENWQPAIQGHIVRMSWDQKAKPTPLLVLEQFEEGINVSFRTNPVRSATAAELE